MNEQPQLAVTGELLFDAQGFPTSEALPRTVNTTGRRKGTLYLSGYGPRNADIMFVQSYAHEEQVTEVARGNFSHFKVDPKINKGGAYNAVRDALGLVGINLDAHYYTALVKFAPPKGLHNKIPAHVVDGMFNVLKQEIAEVKPKIIVVFGKLPFQALTGKRLRYDHVTACWFSCPELNCLVFAMPDAIKPVVDPAMCEQFRVNFADLAFVYAENVKAVGVDAWSCRREELQHSVINTAAELREWVAARIEAGDRRMSIDAEFGGLTLISTIVRCFQICWKPGHAVYIRFMDDQLNYTFDVDYREAGRILAPLLDLPETKYIGYAVSVDLSRLAYVLGLQWYDKVEMDIQYGEQALDENQEQGLERTALKYTRFGRYDTDLMDWKHENPSLVNEDLGYLRVPDHILIPYALLDVEVPMRAYRPLLKRLLLDETYLFYQEFANKLVGNMFVSFMLTGLPVKRDKLESLRELYAWGREELGKEFLERYSQRMTQMLLQRLTEFGSSPEMVMTTFMTIRGLDAEGKLNEAFGVFNAAFSKDADKHRVVLEAYLERRTFNIRTTAHKIRWLFGVMNYIPVKSTQNKTAGRPAMPWARVLDLPPLAQKLYNPAVDKQTLIILANDNNDDLVSFCLDVMAVGTIHQSVLKPADRDEEGELIRERGISYWVADDNRIHCNYAATETWRPRAWKPNVLNWSSYVHKGVQDALLTVMKKRHAEGVLPPKFEQCVTGGVKIPSVRSVVDVTDMPPAPGSAGWILVESDYDTAELVGQAYQSGDANFIRLLTEPDTQFGIPKDDPEKGRVRLHYAPDYKIAPENQDANLIMSWTEDNKLVKKYDSADLITNADGSLLHPKHDLHWGLVEYILGMPREYCYAKQHRTAIGKTGNFKTAYGATAVTLERAFKADTGKEPPLGLGKQILDTLDTQRPVASEWLRNLEKAPENPGFIQAESGAKRHFITHSPTLRGISFRTKKSILSALSREARNFLLQHSVAAAAIRACDLMMAEIRSNNQEHLIFPMAVLYDSMVTLCPIELRFDVRDMHQRTMADNNKWHNHGKTWNYTATHELNFAWSSVPDKVTQKLLSDKTYKTQFNYESN